MPRLPFIICLTLLLTALTGLVPSLLAAAPSTVPATAPAVPSPQNLLTAYETVLTVMKSPPRAGLLVAEFNPRSPAEAAGLRPGDLLFEYAGQAVTTEADLRRQIADAASTADPNPLADPRLPVRVVRAGRTITLQVPTGGLGATLLEAEAGVALPLNPPATPRGQLALAWDKVPVAKAHPTAPAGGETWSRLYDQGQFVGFGHRRLEKTGKHYQLQVELHAGDGPGADVQRSVISFATGDQVTTPAFALDEITAHAPGRHLQAARKGPMLVGISSLGADPGAAAGRTVPLNNPTLLGAIPGPALATVAAALPQRADCVLAFALINELDLRTRPGYTLQTLGRQKITAAGQEVEAWAVRVVAFARPVRTFWFDDRRTLLRTDYAGGVSEENVPSEAAARAAAAAANPPASR